MLPIIIAAVATQYVLALVALVLLARLSASTKAYVLWNVFIMLAFFVGPITFFIYYAIKHAPSSP